MAFIALDIQTISGLQSIEIPIDFKINDDKVYLKKTGNALYIIPFHDPWRNLIESVNLFSSDFMENREQADDQVRDTFG